MKIIGISALYYASGCCLLLDDKPIAAAQEGRFTKMKADSSLPKHSNYVLGAGIFTEASD